MFDSHWTSLSSTQTIQNAVITTRGRLKCRRKQRFRDLDYFESRAVLAFIAAGKPFPPTDASDLIFIQGSYGHGKPGKVMEF